MKWARGFVLRSFLFLLWVRGGRGKGKAYNRVFASGLVVSSPCRACMVFLCSGYWRAGRRGVWFAGY